jgi:hypothetical protein
MRAHPSAVFLLIAALGGCRQIAELPPTSPSGPTGAAAAAPAAERPPVWLGSEASVFEHVQKVLEEAGCPEVRTAVFKASEEAALPLYRLQDRTLLIPPFRDGPEKMRERLARMSAKRFAGALTFVDAFDSAASAYEAYGVFMTVAVAHELWHHVHFARKGQGPSDALDAYDVEAEAMEVEQAFLAHLIAKKQVPPRWTNHYRRALLAIRDSIPRFALDAVPDDPQARRQQFARAYALYGVGEAAAQDGVNVQVSAAFTVYAGYTQRRVSLLAKGARPLGELTRPR